MVKQAARSEKGIGSLGRVKAGFARARLCTRTLEGQELER